jgi:TnpA family transposase
MLTTTKRKARNRFEEKYRRLRRNAQRGLGTAVSTLEALLGQECPEEITVAEFLADVGEESVQQAVADCKALKEFNQQGLVSEIDARYGNLRRYTPRFFQLEFGAAPGAESLLQAIECLRDLNEGRRKRLPDDAPIAFLTAPWWHAVRDADGTLCRRAWELGLYFAVKQALKSGDLHLAGSRRHQYFWDMVYSPQDWQQHKSDAYTVLQLPGRFDEVLLTLRNEFEESAALARCNLGKDGFATVTPEGNLKLCKDDKLELSAGTLRLREQLGARMPLVRIEKLLAGIDRLSGFSKHFKSLPGFTVRANVPEAHLHAALIAHGTNVGLFGMGHSNETVTVDQLRHASHWLIRDQTLNAANAELVAAHRRYPICTVWGDGRRSSSDGQRFGIQKCSLLGSFHPRYFGYYDRAVTVYTHVSDQYSVFNTAVISCSIREATHVLDGLLANITDVRPEFHSTDTHGYTDHIFALCYLLGFSFQPRLADIPHQRLYKLDRADDYGELDPLFAGTADIALIREQWDQLVRIAASLKNGIAPAHIILERLAGRAPSDKVAKALAALGRIVKSTYILRYVSDAELRHCVQLQLNRGESRHQLAKHLFFVNHGIFKTNDLEQIMNKATCLSLLSNAVLVWNTHHIARTVSELRRQGHCVDDDDLAHISPLWFKDVLVHGTYDFSDTQVVI